MPIGGPNPTALGPAYNGCGVEECGVVWCVSVSVKGGNGRMYDLMEAIKIIHSTADITPRTILAGDFNCVENVERGKW